MAQPLLDMRHVELSYNGKPLVIKKGVFTTEEKGFRRPMSFHEPLPL